MFQCLEKAAEKVPSAVAKAMAGQEGWKKQEWESPRGAKAAESLIRDYPQMNAETRRLCEWLFLSASICENLRIQSS